MNHCYHSINGLKGAAAAEQVEQQSVLFPPSELSLISKSLELSRFYITRNPQQFQQPQEMLQKINQGINIISSRTNNKTKTKTNNNNKTINSVKGASLVLDNNNGGFQSLINIRRRFGLLVNNNNNALKSASISSSNNNNNNICNNKKSLINIREHFNLI